VTKPSCFRIDLVTPQTGVSEEEIDLFERETNLRIPPDYRRFLGYQNGGSPKRRNFTFGDKTYQDSVLRSFLGVNCPRSFDLRFILEQYAGRIPEKNFLIAIDEFDNLLLISQQWGAGNQVLFWDHDREITGNTTTHVAPNLRAFLEMLREDNIKEFDIATIKFEDGTIHRRVLPFRYFSFTKNAPTDVKELTIGEQVRDSGFTRAVAAIEYSKERHPGP